MPAPLSLGPRVFGPHELVVMAIINRTPDSFYAAGRSPDLGAALEAVDRAVDEGAAIIDIGGVRAGYGRAIDAAEELDRVLPAVVAVRERHPALVISVDTWRAEVAERVLREGANLLNDTWAGADPDVVATVAGAGAGLVCSPTGGLGPRTDPHRVSYPDVVADVIATVTGAADRAVAAGVPRGSILIDPTHDFGKNTWHSLELSRRLGELSATGWPVLVALSRKDFIGETLGLGPADRLEGTLAVTAIAAWQGARVFRAHDVRATRRVLDMVGAVRGTQPPLAVRRGLA
jgi:dihydropteroate synthase